MVHCLNCSFDADHNHPKSFVYTVLLVGILCALLNGLVLLILLSKEKLRQNPYHFLVLLLSLCDFLVGLGFVIFAVRMLNARWMNSKILCVFLVTSVTNGMFLSLFQTFLISLQRYFVICKTKWNTRLFENKRKYVVCMLSWMVVLVFTLGLISPPEENVQELHGVCNTAYVYSRHIAVFNVFTRSSVFFLVLTIVLYCFTIRNVVKMNRKIVPQHGAGYPKQKTFRRQKDSPTTVHCRELRIAWGPQNVDFSSTRPPCVRSVSAAKEYVQTQPQVITQHAQIAALRRKKIINTVVLVGLLMVFLVFLSGPLILSLVFPDLPVLYMIIATGLCCLNSLVNPFIYCWKIPEVKDALIQLPRKVFRCS